MLDGHAAVPLVRYVDGIVGFDKAKEEILDRCLKYIQKQMDVFARYQSITWLEHEPALLSKPAATISAMVL